MHFNEEKTYFWWTTKSQISEEATYLHFGRSSFPFKMFSAKLLLLNFQRGEAFSFVLFCGLFQRFQLIRIKTNKKLLLLLLLLLLFLSLFFLTTKTKVFSAPSKIFFGKLQMELKAEYCVVCFARYFKRLQRTTLRSKHCGLRVDFILFNTFLEFII